MPGPLTRHVAAKLRAAVEQRGLTQEQVGEQLGQSQSQVSKYLRGEVTLDLEEVDVICRTVGLNITELIRAADEETKDRLK